MKRYCSNDFNIIVLNIIKDVVFHISLSGGYSIMSVKLQPKLLAMNPNNIVFVAYLNSCPRQTLLFSFDFHHGHGIFHDGTFSIFCLGPKRSAHEYKALREVSVLCRF